jgi:hypothetical protein
VGAERERRALGGELRLGVEALPRLPPPPPPPTSATPPGCRRRGSGRSRCRARRRRRRPRAGPRQRAGHLEHLAGGLVHGGATELERAGSRRCPRRSGRGRCHRG